MSRFFKTLGWKFESMKTEIKYGEFRNSWRVLLVSVTRRFSFLSKTRFLLEWEWDSHGAGTPAACIRHAVTMDWYLIWGSGSCCEVHCESALRSIVSVTQIPFGSWTRLPAWCWGRDNKSTVTFGGVFYFWGVLRNQKKWLLQTFCRRKGAEAASGTNNLRFTAHWWAAREPLQLWQALT